MKRSTFFLSGILLLSGANLFAQETYAPQCDPCIKKRLPQTIGSLALALESQNPGLQATAAQTVRDLKAYMPGESFSRLVIPLMRIVKDESADHGARILAALALHELNSAKGNFAIKQMVLFSQDRQLRHLCGAMTVRRIEQEQAAPSRETESKPVIAATD